MSTMRADWISAKEGFKPTSFLNQWGASCLWCYNQRTPASVRENNVTSFTDNNTGRYSFDFNVSMAGSLTYSASGNVEGQDDTGTNDDSRWTVRYASPQTFLTSQEIQMITSNGASARFDTHSGGAIHGELAI